jgi:hypothetical protein
MLHTQAESATLWLVLGKTARAMTDASIMLPNGIDALRTLILAERAAHAAVIVERDNLAVRNERLEAIIAESAARTSAASPSASPMTSWHLRSTSSRLRLPRCKRRKRKPIRH